MRYPWPRERTGSSYALPVTGVAELPTRTMWVGLADERGTIALQRQFLGVCAGA